MQTNCSACDCQPITAGVLFRDRPTVIARCLQLNGAGHVFAMEHMPKFAAMTRTELQRQGLSDCATVLDAPLVADGGESQWYGADALPDGAMDLLLVDGPLACAGDSSRYPAGPKLFPRLSANGTVFVKNAKRPEDRAVI